MRALIFGIVVVMVAGCSAAPPVEEKPVVEETATEPKAPSEDLSECPCGDGRQDWESPPPGARNPKADSDEPAAPATPPE